MKLYQREPRAGWAISFGQTSRIARLKQKEKRRGTLERTSGRVPRACSRCRNLQICGAMHFRLGLHSLVFVVVLGGCLSEQGQEVKPWEPAGSESCEPELSSDERRTDCSDYRDSSFELERSIAEDETFAYSIAVPSTTPAEIEIFAENTACSTEPVLLGKAEVADRVACFVVRAPVAFSHLRTRISRSGFFLNQRVCPVTSCPASEP